MKSNALQIAATGSNIATSGTSASVAIPNTAAGTKPKYVRIAATAAAYVKVGVSGLTAAAGDALVQPGDAVELNVMGATHIAAIQVSVAGVVQISPLEDS